MQKFPDMVQTGGETARLGPGRALVPIKPRLNPDQPDLVPVGPCVSSLICDSQFWSSILFQNKEYLHA